MLNAGEQLTRRIERDTRGVVLSIDQLQRIVAALAPCVATTLEQRAIEAAE